MTSVAKPDYGRVLIKSDGSAEYIFQIYLDELEQEVNDALAASAEGALLAANNLSDVASASTSRTNLVVDVAGTDNSTNVSLAGTPTYLTIVGQVITRALINLTSHVTGTLPLANGGTNATTAGTARTSLDVDVAGTDNSTNVSLAGTPDYITISGQVITRALINLTTHVTGVLPAANSPAVLTEEFLSTAQTITSAGTATIAHGLSAKPKIIQAYIECTTADFNWVVGDEVELPTAGHANNRGIAVSSDATNIFYKYGSDSLSLIIINKSNGNTATLTNANWQMFIRAFA